MKREWKIERFRDSGGEERPKALRFNGPQGSALMEWYEGEVEAWVWIRGVGTTGKIDRTSFKKAWAWLRVELGRQNLPLPPKGLLEILKQRERPSWKVVKELLEQLAPKVLLSEVPGLERALQALECLEDLGQAEGVIQRLIEAAQEDGYHRKFTE